MESNGNCYNVGVQLKSFVYNTVVGWCASAPRTDDVHAAFAS